MNNFVDSVDGLSVREQAICDSSDDVKGALQKLPGVGTVQLFGAKHSFYAVPEEEYTQLLYLWKVQMVHLYKH